MIMERARKELTLLFTSLFLLLALGSFAQAQTDIHISGAQAGFPVATPRLCDAGGAEEAAASIPDLISRDLQISGLFKVLNAATFVETPGKCGGPETMAYSDWSIIGAEGVVKGVVQLNGSVLEATIYLHDVLQQRAVIGKKYQAEKNDAAKIAHLFANEIMFYFTGERGVFGTQLVYVSRVGRFKELFRMDLNGTNVVQLTRDRGLALSPAWSPSGDKIVYTSYRSRKPDLYFLPPSGGMPTRVTDREGLELGARFSPDGSTLAASVAVDGISKIMLLNLQGRILNRLTTGGSIEVSPSWSPDGSAIAFCSNRLGGPQIFVMPSSGGEARRISHTGSNYCTSPSWSPRGDKVVFVCRKGGFQLFLASPNGDKVTQLTFTGNNEDPSWSPDGRFIVYSSNFGRGGSRNIAVLSLLGGRPTQVSFAKSEDSQPAWSPVMQ